MPYYKLYRLDENDRVTGRHERPYRDDAAAIAGAGREFAGETMEIWEGARCILTCPGNAARRSADALHRPVDVLA